MISFLKHFSLFAIAISFSCDKSSNDMHPVVLECDEQAIEIVEDMTGTMLYLACYDAWAVKLDESIHEDDETIIASLDVDPRFQTDKMTVNIEACLHEFDLPLLFPDPVVFGYMYKMENFNLNSN